MSNRGMLRFDTGFVVVKQDHRAPIAERIRVETFFHVATDCSVFFSRRFFETFAPALWLEENLIQAVDPGEWAFFPLLDKRDLYANSLECGEIRFGNSMVCDNAVQRRGRTN